MRKLVHLTAVLLSTLTAAAQAVEPETILLELTPEGSYLDFHREQLEDWLCGNSQGNPNSFLPEISEDPQDELDKAGVPICQTAQDIISAGTIPPSSVRPLIPMMTGNGDSNPAVADLSPIVVDQFCQAGIHLIEVCGRWLVDQRLAAPATGSLLLTTSGETEDQGLAVVSLSLPLELRFYRHAGQGEVLVNWELDLQGLAPWTRTPGADAYISDAPFLVTPMCTPDQGDLLFPPTSDVFLGWRPGGDKALPTDFCLQGTDGRSRLCLKPALLQ